MLSLFSYFLPNNYSQNKFYYLSLLQNDKCSYGYTIHGLWPQYDEKNYPTFCKKVTFDIDKLQEIKDELITFWELPEDTNKLETKFWKHEWEKHGSCMYSNINELEYFKKALELYHFVMNKEGVDIKKYKKGKNYLIPFDINFKMLV